MPCLYLQRRHDRPALRKAITPFAGSRDAVPAARCRRLAAASCRGARGRGALAPFDTRFRATQDAKVVRARGRGDGDGALRLSTILYNNWSRSDAQIREMGILALRALVSVLRALVSALRALVFGHGWCRFCAAGTHSCAAGTRFRSWLVSFLCCGYSFLCCGHSFSRSLVSMVLKNASGRQSELWRPSARSCLARTPMELRAYADRTDSGTLAPPSGTTRRSPARRRC